MTPDSATGSYLTAADFLKRFDVRTTGQLCADDNTQPDATALEDSNTVYGANLLAALQGASGQLESALFVSNMYAYADLQSLTGVSLEYLKDIVAGLTVRRLYYRRGGLKPSDLAEERYQQAMEAIQKLHNGEAIFSFVQTGDAGLPDNHYLNLVDIQRNDLMPFSYQRVFGIRNNQRSTLNPFRGQ